MDLPLDRIQACWALNNHSLPLFLKVLVGDSDESMKTVMSCLAGHKLITKDYWMTDGTLAAVEGQTCVRKGHMLVNTQSRYV